MTAISNDKQLRSKLDSLDIEQQRILGAQFVRSIIHLSSDNRIGKALDIAENARSLEEEQFNAYKMLKTIATKSYTDCGSETDWIEQAEHFVASAAMACLTPDRLITKGKSVAWKTAIQARMAKNCEMIEKDSGEIDNEALKQYRMAEEFCQLNPIE